MPLGIQEPLFSIAAVESFRRTSQYVVREVVRRDHSIARSRIRIVEGLEKSQLSASDLHDLCWLRSSTEPGLSAEYEPVRVVDLFAGCGGLSVGIREACRALGYRMESVLANDFEARTLDIYGLNFTEADLRACPVEELLDSPVGSKSPSTTERRLRAELGKIDLVIGGPPCQGHSNLNNHTRNQDPKNELYMRMVRFCEVVRPESVVIENVPGVIRDRDGVAQRAWKRLEQLGYSVDTMVIDSSKVGAAQKRKRSITVASLSIQPSLSDAVPEVAAGPRPVTWAISDLIDAEGLTVFDTPAEPSPENARRMNHLIDSGLYELPDSKRPDCHRLKPHTYDAMYGRLYPDRPSPTITTGFGSMGRGRFTHYALPRTITPHEAARIQFFPDFYDFGTSGRTLLHRMIGNAVPPKLGYAIGLHLLR